MVIAGEASGDQIAAELVQAIRSQMARREPVFSPDNQPLTTSLEPVFFGAGGPKMAAAGVDLAFDMTQHSVIGLAEALRHFFKFRRLFQQLQRLAAQRQPDVIVCVDFSGFNRRFAQAVKRYARTRHDWFHDWQPRLVQYVSPQVWASREGRAYQMARDYDLLLSIFPFEKDWYARRVPQLRVEFVGHPIFERYAAFPSNLETYRTPQIGASPCILLLPGSRASELARHLPVMLGALETIRDSIPAARVRMVLPNASLADQAKAMELPAGLEPQVGGLPEALREADLAIASTGTVTVECAYFGVPTVALYKSSWSDYEIGKRLIRVKHLAMPNLLANEELFPEFIQHAASARNLAHAALHLLQDEARRRQIKARLTEIVRSLGGPGASRRAAEAVLSLLNL